MKKFLFLTSCAALALASCSDDLGLKPNMTQPVEGKYKITAEYNFGMGDETRTSLSYNDGFAYHWDDGDAIGLFNAEGNDFTNAMFRYAGEGNIFTGDVNIFTAPQVYAYYPYDPQANVSNTPEQGINLYIKQYQNYNYDAVKGVEWNNTYPIGYFAQGAAPAVALGTVAEDALSMTFEDVATYLVFPVAGEITENIKNFTLTIGDGDTNQILWGTVTAEMESLKNPFSSLDVVYPNSEQNATTNQDNITITLNAGNSFKLSKDELVNLWFVVPEGVELGGQTITLTANYYPVDADGNVSSELAQSVATRTMPAGTAPTQRNNVRWIFAVPNSDVNLRKPFYFIPSSANSYVIQTPQQFLEYAYVATAGASTALSTYNAMTSANSNFAAYSDLMNMLNTNKNGLKPALLANPISVTQSAIQAFLGTTTTTYLPDYLQNVYGSYLTSGQLNKPIGGSSPFNINGNGQTLSYLKVVGDALFKPFTQTQYGMNTLTNITLSNVTVVATNATGTGITPTLASKSSASTTAFGLLPYPSSVYKNVTIGDGCSVSLPEVESPNVVKAGVFATLAASASNGENKVVVNKSSLPLAVQFQVNDDYNFTDNLQNATPASFLQILISEEGHALTIEDETAAVSLIGIVKQPTSTVNGYSVVDNAESPTSYWTGTAYDSEGGYAENLAYVAQNSAADEFTQTEYNLNLMGTYANTLNTVWWAAPQGVVKTVSSADEDTDLVISNVYINGYKVFEPKENENYVTNQLSLLGNGSIATNLVVNNITITTKTNPVKNVGYVIAAISGYPAEESLVQVSNYNLDLVAPTTANGIKYNGNAVGGLYNTLNNGTLPFISEDSSFSAGTLSYGTLKFGQIAGTFEVTTSTTEPTEITNPLGTSYSQPFGVFNLSVALPTEATTTMFVVLNNFPTNYAGENSIINATPASGDQNTPTTNNTLNINQINGASKTTYQWNAAYNSNKWSYKWQNTLTNFVPAPESY